MKQETAVEWLISQMPNGVKQYLDDYKDVLTKAIKLEKEQLKQAWENESLNDNYGWQEFYEYKFGDRKKLDDHTIAVFQHMYGKDK